MSNEDAEAPAAVVARARRKKGRIAVMAALIAAYIAMSIVFQALLEEETVYSHFAYIPLVLAGIWWGWRGVFVGLLLAGVLLVFHLTGTASAELASDLGRIFFFLFAGVFFGFLGERLEGGRLALQDSESRHRQLIEKSLTGIFVYRDDRILFSNRPFAAMVGYAPERLAGVSIWDLIHEKDRAAVRERLSRRRAGEMDDLHYETRLVRTDGEVIWADVASSPLMWDEKPSILVNLYDITARKEAEEKERELQEITRKQEEQLVHSTRLAELGEMAAAVAHELNQPLTGIRNFAKNAVYMIEEEAGNRDDVLMNLRMISDQVGRASKIIGQMRDLSRKSEGEPAPLDVNLALREILDLLGPEFRRKGIDVRAELGEELPAILGDRIRIEQVFLNLLNNAVHALEEAGQKDLLLATRLEAGAPGRVIVEVKDTGVGFAGEDVEKLFTPFYSTAGPGQGTGLGLSISLNIVKEHGGTIEAEGRPGEGACFCVKLPVPGR